MNNGSFAPAKAEKDRDANTAITATLSDFKNMVMLLLDIEFYFLSNTLRAFELSQILSRPSSASDQSKLADKPIEPQVLGIGYPGR